MVWQRFNISFIKLTGTSGAYRQALRYIIRNTSLPKRMRTSAQLQLAQMHCYTRPTQIKNRCVMGGVARGVLRAFRMGRVRSSRHLIHLSNPGVDSTVSLTGFCDCTVSISNERTRGKFTGCKESQLVMREMKCTICEKVAHVHCILDVAQHDIV